jgi:hypothetical protein
MTLNGASTRPILIEGTFSLDGPSWHVLAADLTLRADLEYPDFAGIWHG